MNFGYEPNDQPTAGLGSDPDHVHVFHPARHALSVISFPVGSAVAVVVLSAATALISSSAASRSVSSLTRSDEVQGERQSCQTKKWLVLKKARRVCEG